MNLIANKVNFKKLAVLLLLLTTVVGGINAFAAMSKTSTAVLEYAKKAEGKNTNIWDGKASVSATNSTPGSVPDFSATIKKSVALLPDPTTWNRNMTSRGSFSTTVSIKDASTYYAQASTIAFGLGEVKVKSLDTSW